MRALVFLGSFAVSTAVFHAATDVTWFFAALMSACAAALVSTVATRSGRVAGRRIVSNLAVGWRRAA